MTPAAYVSGRFTRWWVRWYTRGLPREARDNRRSEIESDVFDQLENARQESTPARSAGAEVLWRTLRGMGDDVLWRLREGHAMKTSTTVAGPPTGLRALWATATSAWFTPIAVLLGLLNMLGAVLVVIDRSGKMPGQVIGPIIMVSLAVSLFVGLWLRWTASPTGSASAPSAKASRKPAILLIGLATLAAAATGFGIASGVIVFLVGGVGALVVVGARQSFSLPTAERARIGPKRRHGLVLADALVIVGVLPAIGLFWMVIPPILALIVIAGVIGTGVRPRRASVA